MDRKVSEETVAKTVNLSSNRFRQLFKKETGRSPTEYIMQLRMETARCFLTASFLSVKEVAFKTGWGDVSHFVRYFKKRHGMTPKEFRNLHTAE